MKRKSLLILVLAICQTSCGLYDGYSNWGSLLFWPIGLFIVMILLIILFDLIGKLSKR